MHTLATPQPPPLGSTRTHPPLQVLIAGIGNIFLRDDAFGCAVIRELAGRTLPEGVRAHDFGIRGYDLAFAIGDRCEALILVDAVTRGEPPGTVFIIEPDLVQLEAQPAGLMEGHSLDPVRVLQFARMLGGSLPRRVYLIGCEPERVEAGAGENGLSEAVQTAVPLAVQAVERVLDRLQEDRRVEHE